MVLSAVGLALGSVTAPDAFADGSSDSSGTPTVSTVPPETPVASTVPPEAPATSTGAAQTETTQAGTTTPGTMGTETTNASISSAREQLVLLEEEQAELSAENAEIQARLDLATARLQTTKDQIAAQEEKIEILRPQIVRIALQEYQDRGMSGTVAFFACEDVDEMLNYLSLSHQVASTSEALLQTLQLEQASLSDLQANEAAIVAAIEEDKAAVQQNALDLANKVAQTQKLLNTLVSYAAQAVAARAAADGSASANVVNPSLGLINPLPGGLKTRAFGQGGHTGLDLAKPCGTHAISPANGVVVDYFYDGSLGNRLTINNGVINGHEVMTSYAHLSGTLVAPGTTVSQGQDIVLVGATGYATGCHLHFMLYIDGQLVNPEPYI